MYEGDTTMAYIWNGDSDKGEAIAMISDFNKNEVICLTSYVLVSFQEKLIKEGSGSNGTTLANLEGDFIREGNNSNGRILAVIKGDEIKQVDLEDKVLFKIEGIASKTEEAALAVAALMLEGQL
jgi:hypothetical protein